MRAHVREFRLVAMCRVLGVHRSGYYAWLRNGPSAREREDQRLLGLIKHHWLASGGVYGYRKITVDLREAGESCSRHRRWRLASWNHSRLRGARINETSPSKRLSKIRIMRTARAKRLYRKSLR